MQKIARISILVLFGVLCLGISSIAEEITLTTYYPAPYGAYVELSVTEKLDVTDGLVIGASYVGTETAPTSGMLVEGNVGIGTTVPGAELDVSGTINATTIKATTDYLTATGTPGYTGPLRDRQGFTIADVENGLITAVYF